MLSLILSQDFEIICGEELYYNKCRQYLPLQLMNHLIIIREYNLLGSLIEGQSYTFKNNHRSLMTQDGLINGPFMRKN